MDLLAKFQLLLVSEMADGIKLLLLEQEIYKAFMWMVILLVPAQEQLIFGGEYILMSEQDIIYHPGVFLLRVGITLMASLITPVFTIGR